MMKRLFQSLRRLFIVALVGVFISVGTFTQKAAAAPQRSLGDDSCTIKVESQTFKNPPFAYAHTGKITLEATDGQFTLDGGKPEINYNGYLYKATYIEPNADGEQEPTGPKPAYTPPTIVVSPGKTIDLTLTNDLPPDVQLAGQIPPTEENIQNQSQDTNLHYHGFNVSPLLGSDDVVMHVHSNKTNPSIDSGGIYPGDKETPPKYGSIAEYHMRVNLPQEHQSGLFWYHPHVHTVSDNQVRAGMSGGIIVNGIEEFYTLLDPNPNVGMALTSGPDSIATPTLPQPDPKLAITQQVMLFKDFNNVLGDTSYNCFTLNGQIQPFIKIKPGEVQFWRIGNIGADTYLNLSLNSIEPAQLDQPYFYILARDGGAVYTPIKTKEVLLPPASRVELLVVGGKSSEVYHLVSKPSDEATAAYEGTLAEVRVDGAEPIPTYNCPLDAPKDSCEPGKEITNMDNYITRQHATKHNDRVRKKTDNDKVDSSYLTTYERTLDNILPDPEQLSGYPDCQPQEQDHTKCIWKYKYPDEPLTQERTFKFNSGTLGSSNSIFTINGKLYDENRIDKVSHLGDIEDWKVSNNTGQAHAFHMHQLDFIVTHVTLPQDPGTTYDNYIVSNKKCQPPGGSGEVGSQKRVGGVETGKSCDFDLKPQGYRDTINLPPGSTTTIRIPFLNPFITGVFVYHCHILSHEDRGMMQNLQVIDPKSYQEIQSLKKNNPESYQQLRQALREPASTEGKGAS